MTERRSDAALLIAGTDFPHSHPPTSVTPTHSGRQPLPGADGAAAPKVAQAAD
jgi:hypothetical protein